MPQARIFQTTTFRLATVYVLSFAASVAALGVIVCLATSVALEHRLDARIEEEMVALQATHQSGGLAHTSIVLRDAVAACAFPVVEVHISDIGKREPFRHHTYLKDVTAHQVIGKGVAGYEEALRWLLDSAHRRP